MPPMPPMPPVRTIGATVVFFGRPAPRHAKDSSRAALTIADTYRPAKPIIVTTASARATDGAAFPPDPAGPIDAMRPTRSLVGERSDIRSPLRVWSLAYGGGVVVRRFLDMRSGLLAGDEDGRLAALHRLGVLDTGAEERFDRLVQLASAVCDVPIALVTLVDRDRQWFKARVGIDMTETAREIAFCDHAIRSLGAGPFVVEDAARDERFATNPLVIGEPTIRFYAGQVITDLDGYRVGTLCVMDRRPRILDDNQTAMLVHLAKLVETELHRREELDLLMELDGVVRSKAAILNSLREGLVVQDTTGAIVDWNPAAEHLLGLSSDELAGRASTDPRWLAVRENGEPWSGDTHPAMLALRSGQPAPPAVMGVHRPGGSRVWLRVNAEPILDDDGAVKGVITSFADVTIEHHQRVLLDATWQTAPIGLVMLDEQRRIVRCNATYAGQVGRPIESLLGIDPASLLHPDDQAAAIGRRVPVGTDGRDTPLEARVCRPDGSEISVAVTTAHLTDPEPMVIAAVVDTTDHRRLTTALVQYRYLFEHATDIIVVVGQDLRARYASPSLTRVLGVPTDGTDLTGALRALAHPDDRALIGEAVRDVLTRPAGTRLINVRLCDRTREWRHFELEIVNLLGQTELDGIVLTAHDITEREQLSRVLEHRATHDHLTGLAARMLFEQQVTRALAQAARHGHRLAVGYMDLDGFKAVNDARGHSAGDALLVDVADRIRDAVRAGDLAARLGGDEFALLLDPVRHINDALLIATRVRDSVLTADPTVGISIGIALNEPPDTTTTIIHRADQAQYHSKNGRTSTVTVATI